MVFRSSRQRKAVMAKFTAFSYVTGRRLGRFNTLTGVFDKFPKERKAFNQVKVFNKRTGLNVTTTKQIKDMTKNITLSPRMRIFIDKKISRNIREGRPQKVAIAIAFSQARKKFGNGRLTR